jgi:amino acid transporter
MVPSGFLFWGTVVFGVAQCREYSISLNMAELMTTELEIVTLFPLDGSFIRLAGRYVIATGIAVRRHLIPARFVDPALGVAVGWNHFVSKVCRPT